MDGPAPSFLRRKSSSYSRRSAEDPLLYRHDSIGTEDGRVKTGNKISQKTYVITEDMTIVVTGFRTKPLGYLFYILLCIATLGLGFIVFRWLPRWRVRLIGTPNPLRDCKWVAVEVGLSKISDGYRAPTKFLAEPMGRIFCPRYKKMCIWIFLFFRF